jgi:hypothetical protein
MTLHPHSFSGHSFWYYVFEGAYFLLQGGSAKMQAVRIAKNLPIYHFWYAAAMVVVALLMVVAYKKLAKCRWKEAAKLGLSLLLVRFVSFGPWLNKLRHLKFFYIGRGSLQDRILANVYPLVWSLALAGLLVLQFI